MQRGIKQYTSVDGTTTGTITTGEITTLAHEVGDNTMELAALVGIALLTSAQSAEVLCGLWNNISEELEDHASLRLAIDLDVEVYLRILHGQITGHLTKSTRTKLGGIEGTKTQSRSKHGQTKDSKEMQGFGHDEC